MLLGGQVQFTSQNSVTWSLAPGSTGTINSASGLYTAPVSFAAKNQIAGCPLLPNDHIYNTRIDALPLDSSSTVRIGNVSNVALGFEVSFPVNIMSLATPTTSMNFFYTTNYNGQSFPLLAFPYQGVENEAIPNSYIDSDDRHALGVNTDNCKFYEIYKPVPVGTLTPFGCPTCNASSGVEYDAMSYKLADNTNGNGGTTDAAGMFIQPLAIRYSELKAGAINHAMRMTLANGFLFNGSSWPATNSTNECNDAVKCFPYGSRIRLKSAFNISSYSPPAQVILTALKKYGAFVADGGISFHIQTMSDVTADTITWNAILSEIQNAGISKNSFEQVDESSLMISTFTGNVNLSNPYVIPDNFASVMATNISDGVTSSSVSIAIQPVTIGHKNIPFPPNSAGLSVMAGTPQFQIPYFINGATNTSVNCTISPTVGTLTSGCLYTAPAIQVNSLSTATVTIAPTGTAGTVAAYSFPLVIFPSDGIRFNVGGMSSDPTAPVPPYDAQGNYGPDAGGKYWWSDTAGNIPPWYSKQDGYYPPTSWPSSTDIGLFYTRRNDTSDGAYSAMVPNGNYTLTLGFGTDDSGGFQNSSGTIDSQGIVLLNYQSLLHAAYTPNTLSYPITVTNNQFYFAIRQVDPTQGVMLNKWSLLLASNLPNPPGCVIKGNVKIKGVVSIK